MNTFRERPILMNGESVIGIIDLRKTQTRRVVKGKIALDWLQPGMFSPRYVALPENYLSPFGYCGDLLWVRETWGAVSKTEERASLKECNIEYRADLPAGCTDYPGDWSMEDARGNDEAPRWRPSIFMPRWASRITLKITNVRVERLQEIDMNGFVAEGIHVDSLSSTTLFPERDTFIDLWNRINLKRGYSWDSNPWVWVIEFEKVEGK